eukprot:278344-Pyramimonas_sp.AAC.1
MSFGSSRHRAWVVDMKPIGCSLGSRGRILRGLMEAVRTPLGGLFWASWGPPGASWGFLPLRGILGPPGAEG